MAVAQDPQKRWLITKLRVTFVGDTEKEFSVSDYYIDRMGELYLIGTSREPFAPSIVARGQWKMVFPLEVTEILDDKE